MRAAVITAHGGLDAIAVRTDHPRPRVEPHQVLVRVAATAVNFHDLFTRRGMPGIRIKFPIVTGSDIAGVVADVGGAVQGWRAGDRVLVDPLFRPPAHMGMIGETVDGGRAEYVAVAADQLIAVPEAVSLHDAAALPLAYGTAHRMVAERGRITSVERVLILGASGGVGVACVQLCVLLGAEVIVCASSEEKLARLRALGARHGVNYAETDFVTAVHTAFGKPRVQGGGGVDVVINFTGGDTWTPSLRCLRKGGRILTCGATAGYEAVTDLRYVWTFEQQVIGSNGWEREDLTALLDMIAGGRLRPVIGAVLPLEESARAERLLEDREVFGKVLITP